MLRRRLAGHAELLAQLGERLAVPLMQAVEHGPPGRVGQRLEDAVSVFGHATIMQVDTCMLSNPRPASDAPVRH